MRAMVMLRFHRPANPMGWSDIRREYADLLEDGRLYEVDRIEERDWHTKVFLRGFAVPFNSVWFEPVEMNLEALHEPTATARTG